MKQLKYAGRGLLVAILLLPSATVLASPDSDAVIRQALTKIIPAAHDIKIAPSPVPGLSEVLLGSNVYYATNDGKYILQGNLIELATRTDLTEERMKGVRKDELGKVEEQDEIIFAAPDERHVITVFTDIDCGYCRQFHREIAKVNALGIEVHYLFYPRTGPDTESWYKAEKVWCAEDRKTALTEAKLGGQVPDDSCESNPVESHYDLGNLIGVRGTPSIFAANGEQLGGYVAPDELLELLEAIEP